MLNMYTLVGDIGNTDIKLCLLNKNFKIIKKISFDKNHVKSRTYFKKKINSLIKNKNTNKFSLFSSVVPSVFNIIKNVLIKDFKIKIIELKKVNFNKIIKIKANQKQVGSDRIANAVGSYYYYKSNCIIIDFGTATTFDIVINGAYRGGIIAPGIKLSLETLVKSAEQIPLFKITKINNVIGKNTISALRSGFYWGYIGLVQNIIDKISKQTKKKYKVILTGGYSHLFIKSIKKRKLNFILLGGEYKNTIVIGPEPHNLLPIINNFIMKNYLLDESILDWRIYKLK